MSNRVEVSERDVLIFKLLNKFRVLDAELITVLSGFYDVKNTRRRLTQLYDERYIGRDRDGNTTPYIYFLRNKGMTLINKETGHNERPYIIRNFSKSSISHELLVADISYKILQANRDLMLDDLQTDRELRKLGFRADRIGDIRIPKFRVNIEFENTQKTFHRYPKKFAINEDGYGQLWILNGFGTLKHKLNDYIRLRITDRFIQAILLDEVPFYDFDFTEQAAFYQKQQQFMFDEQRRERDENKRMMEEQIEMKKARAKREQDKILEEQNQKSFWRR